ncbi:Leucine Rich repeats (2 copies) [Labrenzia sp. THAF82]|uniref:hypothetical protein n=1 Tax=Labrenzia sp. THAF82 TaxID=2587861 RepID=UPI0012692711|nr:hypothetical protein [Labrenzia sp. THAF82]QFT31461.1 Leucine Rich repeats (2 copies) [Labrenzia sp. THAF82]
MNRTFDAERLDVPDLLQRMPEGSSLSVNTIRKADMKRLKGMDQLPLAFLGLRWLSAPDLTNVPLPPSLKELRIWHSNKLKSLDGIEVATGLEKLDLRENGLLENGSAVRNLPKLHSLSIEGGNSSRQKVETLSFLEGLPLEHLSLVAVEGRSLDLGPVARLPKLKSLDVQGQEFPSVELAKVAASFPWFLDQLLDLPECSINGMACKKCGGRKKELFIKEAKGLWCPDCEAAGLEKALTGFQELVAGAP